MTIDRFKKDFAAPNNSLLSLLIYKNQSLLNSSKIALIIQLIIAIFPFSDTLRIYHININIMKLFMATKYLTILILSLGLLNCGRDLRRDVSGKKDLDTHVSLADTAFQIIYKNSLPEDDRYMGRFVSLMSEIQASKTVVTECPTPAANSQIPPQKGPCYKTELTSLGASNNQLKQGATYYLHIPTETAAKFNSYDEVNLKFRDTEQSFSSLSYGCWSNSKSDLKKVMQDYKGKTFVILVDVVAPHNASYACNIKIVPVPTLSSMEDDETRDKFFEDNF